jgi:16S rRNA C1402 N4-methylase RsmH
MDEFLLKLDLANLGSIFKQGGDQDYNEDEMNAQIVTQMRKKEEEKQEEPVSEVIEEPAKKRQKANKSRVMNIAMD